MQKNPLVVGNPNITFYAGCPVRAPDGRNIGSLCAIDSKTRTLTKDQLNALGDLAKIIESELKVAQLSRAQYDLINELDAAHRQSFVDPVTRLWNQKGLEDILKREWAFCQRNHTPLGIVLADISHFDQITSHYGRYVSDEIIKELAKRFLAALRAEDTVARTCGDQFTILLPACIKNKFEATLARIRDITTSRPVETTKGPIDISVNFGAVIDSPNISLEISEFMTPLKDALAKAKPSATGIEIATIG